ncbi:MAG TPA: FAD-dependent oxidoreductase [Candidatus Didemnitutus sp.]|nr:FAD-dependent oxidoreductase [Candidatus Didemnitutus sp.]
MKLVAGNPFWSGKAATPHYARLRRSLECDVVVLGGGITGALVTHALAEAGVAVVAVDKNEIGGGSSSASTGLLQYETDLPLYRLMRKIGTAAAVRCYRLNREAVEGLARLVDRLPDRSDFAWRGSLYGASKPQHVAGLKREFAARRRHGFAVEYWDRRRVARESSLPFSAALVSSCAAEVDSYRLTHALFAAAVARGARVFAHTAVKRWENAGGKVIVHAAGHRLTAHHLVVASGYEGEPVLPARLARLDSTFAFVSEPVPRLEGWPARRLIWETARPYLYCRTTPDNRVVVGGADEQSSTPAKRDRLLRGKIKYLGKKFAGYFPAIRVRVADAWAGTFATTRDSLPCIGSFPREPEVTYALCYGGNGITFSLVAADIIRDRCLGRRSAAADLFRLDR